MQRKRYSAEVKEQVDALRKKGKSYKEIQLQFPIPKSTLSVWLGKKYKGLFSRKIQLAHLKRIRVIARASIRKARLKREQTNADQGAVVANKIPLANIAVMKALLAMIYWAEGSKYAKGNGVKFANTDPRFAQVYMSLLRKSFPVDESRFRVRLHLHYYHERKGALGFWSKTLNIPSSQFWKIYIKKRSEKKRFRQNSMGICFIYYPGNAIRQELLAIGFTLHGILSNRSLP